MWKLINNSEIS